jgi:hypothetical protein
MITRFLALACAALAAASPAIGQRASPEGWRAELSRLRQARPRITTLQEARAAFTASKISRRVAAGPAASVAESEPNDLPGQADNVALGDTSTGVVNPAGDADYWVFVASAGDRLNIDVDASQLGSPLDPTLELLASDGVTSLAFNDDFDGLDSRIRYQIQTDGQYYIVIRGFGGSGGSGYTYLIKFGAEPACAVVGNETEPNDDAARARAVALGSDGTGVICPSGDLDWWSLAVTAGTSLDLDVDAAQFGSQLDPVLCLVAGDGQTVLACNDDSDGLDSRLAFDVQAGGTLYPVILDFGGRGGDGYTYTIHFRTVAPGPGDPVVTRVANLSVPIGLAAGTTGELFIGDFDQNTILRVGPEGGTPALLSSGVMSPQGMAWDALGNLLVASGADGDVYRVSAQGAATRYLTDVGFAFWVAVGRDGGIWVTDLDDASIRRYDVLGRFQARYDMTSVGGFGPGPITIGPSGDPYFSNGNQIYRLLPSGQPQLLLTADFTIWGFAFDVAGNIYAPNPALGRIIMFGPTGAAIHDPFALSPAAPLGVAFGRNVGGATNARLYATDAGAGTVIEVNPAGVPNPGLPLGYAPQFTATQAADELLGAGGLTPEDQAFLDALGNRNGRYDTGDFRAYLQFTGAIPAATQAAARREDRRIP